ncbi:hypothetical protein E2C01_027554 [Portunus trituberculatus]|uniref:Uncharacterized protein n=1 Tax=Portunus trituberculatus TaxID=210409 RepID=A0A5B7EMA1_PORTR|nr:hypothetical protein [Portunus trituberculatus]
MCLRVRVCSYSIHPSYIHQNFHILSPTTTTTTTTTTTITTTITITTTTTTATRSDTLTCLEIKGGKLLLIKELLTCLPV